MTHKRINNDSLNYPIHKSLESFYLDKKIE